jgi:hypothetical protein
MREDETRVAVSPADALAESGLFFPDERPRRLDVSTPGSPGLLATGVVAVSEADGIPVRRV